MHTVHTSMAPAKRIVRRMRSARMPRGKAPTTPTMAMAKGRKPTTESDTWKLCLMPSTACDSDWRSPLSSAVVPASAIKGIHP